MSRESIMSSKSSSTTQVFQGGKATFSVKLVKGQRQFTAVNKRAHNVTKKLGKRNRHATVTLAELKSTQGKGTYRFFAYTSTGALAPIRF